MFQEPQISSSSFSVETFDSLVLLSSAVVLPYGVPLYTRGCVYVCICEQERAPVKSSGLPAQSSSLPPSSHPQCPQTAHTKHTH